MNFSNVDAKTSSMFDVALKRNLKYGCLRSKNFRRVMKVLFQFLIWHPVEIR